MEILNFIYEIIVSQETLLSTWVLFFVGYVWVVKTDNVDDVAAAHVNDLQDEKLDRDGQIPCTGTSQWDKGADIASAATLAPGNDGNYFDVTGPTTITAINAVRSQPGTVIKLHFDGILKIVHDGNNIILPDGKDIYTLAGTELEFVEYEANKWRATGYLRGTPVLTNLLSNSGFGYWNQSDTNKGLATITYDTGAKGAGTAPSVGDAIVGANGATAKLISYTIASGAWADGDAAGVLTVGAVSHDFAFVDNEVLTFGGVETATINMLDSAVQVGLIQNGGFAAATTGWDVVNCTIASVAGGQVGNCLQLTRTAADAQWTSGNIITTVVGKIYKFSVYIKSGTSGNEAFELNIYNASGTFVKTGTTTAGWIKHTITFEAAYTTYVVILKKATATAGTMLFDEITLYEITPCCTGGDTKAFDGWVKQNTALQIYRQHWDATYTKDGSFYSLKMIQTHAITDSWVSFPGDLYDKEEWYAQFRGEAVTLGAWIYTSASGHCRIRIIDSVGNDQSNWHPGDGAWHWLEVTRIIDVAAVSLEFRITSEGMAEIDGDSIIYVSQPMLVFGSSIGEGNYQPKPQEWIYGEKAIPSNKYDNKTSLSDQAYELLNLEADSDAMIPKGAKAIMVHTEALDSGSGANVDVHIHLRKDATATRFFTMCWGGRSSGVTAHLGGEQPCNTDGDVEVEIEATGAGTLDITRFRFLGVQVN